LGKEIEPSPPQDARTVETTELLKRHWLSKNVFEIELSRPASLNYVPCLLEAASADPSPPGAFFGGAASYLIKNLQPGSYDFYLCGEREMIRGVTLLVDERYAGSYVYTEVFY